MTLADKLMVTDMDVIRNGTWLAVPKYSGTNASQMTQVVYIVKPVETKICIFIFVNINENANINFDMELLSTLNGLM